MTSRLKKLDSDVLQSFTTNNVCFLGIHGMGGIGKSTLARAYYKRMSHKFDGSCFLQNVREVSEKKVNGLVDLQKQLLSNILDGNFTNIRHVDDGIDMIRTRFRHKKLLIVLDDVSKDEQLTALAEEDNWFGSGSIIIVTTREDNFLTIRRYAIYKAEYLNRSEALQLFSWKAFRSNEPPKEYLKLSEQVIEYASYLPLALTVLGPLLGSKDQSEWESALGRLRNCPEKGIVEKLKISFDDLNETDQCIFLDIACFFKRFRFSKGYAEEILDSCGFNAKFGIKNLINKSLLSIRDGYLWMHDLLEEMGKEIVRKESGKVLGRQSRIWDRADLIHILENEEGTNEVEAIVVFPDALTMELKFEALSSMKNLRLLMISSSHTKCDEPKLKYLSNNLQYLEWEGFPYKKLPSSFQPLKLVQLKLTGSNIEQLWSNCVKPLYNLKVINLTGSKHLTKFEDFQVVPNLEKLILCGCEKLLEIHPSIKHLKKLILLDLQWCTSLERLPEEINGLASLQTLNLSHCSLKKLPEEINGLASLQTLNLSHCSKLSEIHPSIEHLKKLILLDLRYCTSLKKLPEEINGLASLQTLNLRGCFKLEKLPDNLEQLKSLRKLEIEGWAIKHLPSSINLMEMLESLNCDIRVIIKSSISEDIRSCGTYLLLLTELDRRNCNLNSFPEYFGKLVHLKSLDLSNNPFSVLPSFKGLSRLESLWLEDCKSLRCLEAELLPCSLQKVNVDYCTSLASFLDPSKPCHLRCSYVYCMDCTELVKRQDAKMTALASLSRFLDQDPSKRRDEKFRFLIPRSDNELPSWFPDQSSTASVSLKLDPNRRNSELIGIAMVFCFRSRRAGYQGLNCKIGVSGGKEWRTIHVDGGYFRNRTSDHLLLLYMPCGDTLEHIKNLKSGRCDSLDFYFLDATDSSYHGSIYGPYGVRLVYEEDIEELKQITTQYIK